MLYRVALFEGGPVAKVEGNAEAIELLSVVLDSLHRGEVVEIDQEKVQAAILELNRLVCPGRPVLKTSPEIRSLRLEIYRYPTNPNGVYRASINFRERERYQYSADSDPTISFEREHEPWQRYGISMPGSAFDGYTIRAAGPFTDGTVAIAYEDVDAIHVREPRLDEAALQGVFDRIVEEAFRCQQS